MDAVEIQHERGAAPIVHEHYSDADLKKAQAEAQKAVRKYMPVKPLDRGRENLSNAVKQTMAAVGLTGAARALFACIAHFAAIISTNAP